MANFTDSKKDEIWAKAQIVDGYDSNIYRQDPAGAWIKYDQYGQEGDYGWGIDHILPVAKDGTGDTRNLCAMHWKNNKSKANDFPEFNIAITSNGNKNEDVVGKRYWGEDIIKMLKELYPDNPHLKSINQ
jgi:hypothetical protein